MKLRSVLATIGVAGVLLAVASPAGAVEPSSPEGCTGSPVVSCTTTTTSSQIVNQVTRPTGKFFACGNFAEYLLAIGYPSWYVLTYYGQPTSAVAPQTVVLTTRRITTTTSYSKYISIPLSNGGTFRVNLAAPLPTSTSRIETASSPGVGCPWPNYFQLTSILFDSVAAAQQWLGGECLICNVRET
jgi:hypothetical protein